MTRRPTGWAAPARKRALTARAEIRNLSITVGAPVRDGFYRYAWQGRDLPSWSTLRAQAGIKPVIHAWALEGMITTALEMGGTLAAAQASGSEEAIAFVRQKLWDAAVEARDTAARLGTAIHEAATIDASLDPFVRPDIAPRLAQFRHWLASTGTVVLAQEFSLYNLTLGYGGTADLLVLRPDGSIWVVDLKTGKSLWGEHALQLMGYAMGEFVGADDVVDESLTEMLRSARGMAVLHLREGEPDNWEFRALRSDGPTWAAFQGLLTFAVWMHDHDAIESVTTAIVDGRRAVA